MIGLDGIALMNVVANPTEAAVTGKKKLQTRITHNDGKCSRSLGLTSAYSITRWLVEIDDPAG